jgi:hypothetical protein
MGPPAEEPLLEELGVGELTIHVSYESLYFRTNFNTNIIIEINFILYIKKYCYTFKNTIFVMLVIFAMM